MMKVDINPVHDKSTTYKHSGTSGREVVLAQLSSGPNLGMARFFTEENLRRYRMLAAKPLNADQRREIIQALGLEMEALRAEMQSTPAAAPENRSVIRRSHSRDSI